MALLDAMGWAMDDEYLLFTVSAGAISSEHADALFQISLNLAQLQPHLHFVIFEGKSVFTCNLAKAGTSREALMSDVAPFLRDQLAKVAFSTPFRSFKNLYYYYRQALSVESAGNRANPTSWLFRYEDYAADIMLDRCLVKAIPQALYPPSLLALIEHDEKRGTDYVNVLRLFLDNDRNIAQTARDAFMHRNTLLYQIGRVKDILRADLNSADKRLALQVALRAYEREKAQAKS